MTELLAKVDWNAWRRVADGESLAKPVEPAEMTVELVSIARVGKGQSREISDAERVAFLVLALGRPRHHVSKKVDKAVAKAIRSALRDIESSVIHCEQLVEIEEDIE